jgi:hypothetical protein
VRHSKHQGEMADCCWDEDAEFIAHSKQDIPKLLEIVKVLRESLSLYEKKRLRVWESEATIEIRNSHGEYITGLPIFYGETCDMGDDARKALAQADKIAKEE